jgi:AcrR family transcriptional regulator
MIADPRVINWTAMSKARYQRRKEDRPDEITAAAFEAFAENGYASTGVADVAKRAGVSKGLLYLYFKTKEELFKAVIKNVVVRRVDALISDVETSELSSEELIRGPMTAFMKKIPDSPVAIVIRLLISEGSRHPDLLDFYYDNVVSKGLAAIQLIIGRGVERGEFQSSAVALQPQLFISPMLLAIVWEMMFSRQPLDTDQLIDDHIDLLLTKIKV